MGSRLYARSCTLDPEIRVISMIAVDTIGCYSRGSRRKRVPLSGLAGLPDRPDYVAFVGNLSSRGLARRSAAVFNRVSAVKARAVSYPAVNRLIAWSDDWAFWQEGVPALTVTDTSFQRFDDNHEVTDTADRLDYLPMAEVIHGLTAVVRALADLL